jgi:stage II sporulation protein AA (anti-sigma F factor antagonist)
MLRNDALFSALYLHYFQSLEIPRFFRKNPGVSLTKSTAIIDKPVFFVHFRSRNLNRYGESFQSSWKGGQALNIDTEKVGRNLFVIIDGELDLETSPLFRSMVEEEMNQDKMIKHLILDLKKVNFIDSSGLGAILGRFKRVSQEGGRLSAINVSPQVKKIFELSGLLKIMNIYSDRKQALENF